MRNAVIAFTKRVLTRRAQIRSASNDTEGWAFGDHAFEHVLDRRVQRVPTSPGGDMGAAGMSEVT
ncbi:MAG TPA: hypothetical protein VGC09_11205 [Rhodopila sp.]